MNILTTRGCEHGVLLSSLKTALDALDVWTCDFWTLTLETTNGGVVLNVGMPLLEHVSKKCEGGVVIFPHFMWEFCQADVQVIDGLVCGYRYDFEQDMSWKWFELHGHDGSEWILRTEYDALAKRAIDSKMFMLAPDDPWYATY